MKKLITVYLVVKLTISQNENPLERYGVTNYEYATYRTLLQRGACDAKVLSEKSDVPTGRIYDVAVSLESKGLLEIQKNSRPKLYSPVKPSVAMRNLLERKKEELELLTENALVVEDELKMQFRETPSESLFWKIGVGKEAINKFDDRLKETEKEILFYGEFTETKPKIYAAEIQQELKTFVDLMDRGVTIKVLLGINDATALQELLELTIPFIKQFDPRKIEVRITKKITLPFVIMDREKILLKIKNPANLDEYFASFYVWQRKFAIELSSKFQEIWRESEVFNWQNMISPNQDELNGVE